MHILADLPFSSMDGGDMSGREFTILGFAEHCVVA